MKASWYNCQIVEQVVFKREIQHSRWNFWNGLNMTHVNSKEHFFNISKNQTVCKINISIQEGFENMFNEISEIQIMNMEFMW